MSKLSKRQEEILAYIKDEVKKKGTRRPSGKLVKQLDLLQVPPYTATWPDQKKGYIRRDPTKPRAIEVLSLGFDNDTFVKKETASFIPVIGKVTAGVPITAVENVEDYLPLPDHLAAYDNTYALVIQGESMIEAGIYDGDQVIVRQQQTADNGDIIVAMTEDNEATVKRFFREKDYIRLQPENSSMEPIILENCTILGKVIGVFRTIH